MLVVLLIGLPILFAMLVWVIVTALRLLRPEEPVPLHLDPRVQRIRALQAREVVPVGAEDIRELERRQGHALDSHSHYDYLEGRSEGFPGQWLEDLDLRRN